jgi:hypothetical protein
MTRAGSAAFQQKLGRASLDWLPAANTRCQHVRAEAPGAARCHSRGDARDGVGGGDAGGGAAAHRRATRTAGHWRVAVQAASEAASSPSRPRK